MGRREPRADGVAPHGSAGRGGPLRIRARPARQQDGAELVAHEGEIIGLAGLAGHGQTRLLLAIFAHRPASDRVEVTAPVALVAGDRQSDGIFPLWSIAENIGIRSLARLRNGLLISPQREAELAASLAGRSASARPT